jgi:hypothetical protein
MEENIYYTENVSSKRTEALFIALTLLSGTLLIWQASTLVMDLLVYIFSGLFLVFLFYSINYRILTIRLTQQALQLKFGIFT